MFQEQERDCSFMVELNAPTDGSELGKMSKTVVTLVNDDGKFIELVSGTRYIQISAH